MKLASWNINGIRAAAQKGLIDWVKLNKFDIFSFQETKALKSQYPQEIFENQEYSFFISSAEKKGYSGVATFTKIIPISSKIGINIEKFDNEGRTIILEFENFYLINGYFPNGQRDHARVPFKLEYSNHILEIAKKYSQKKGVIICGDINTAHTEIDLKNPKANKDTTGFLPHEREYIDNVLSSGFVDIFRELHPNEKGHYSWWSYMGNARAKNVGWRIDYFFISESLKKNVKNCYYQPEVMGSDHCPIILELEI